ncbi:hypothetical protein [Psychroserpens jangbogonensis]|uniref:hypothetical protein n=1 Tax=Psychroserpens jangbogonensis TaxID=1484460 RepID=UPI00053EECB1|nr:hypothetical protein [Psychroserpens jangbogonensis]
MKHLKFIFLSLLIISTISCSKDDDSSEDDEDDIQQLVENFVTPDLIATLVELGYTFRDGNDTPNISGNFLYTPHAFKSSNIPGDLFEIGYLFSDNTYEFSNLNPENRTFTFSNTNNAGSDFGDVTDTFYSGNGNEFSAYIKLSTTIDDNTAIILYAISGIITEDGISEAEDAVIMLDNMGNPSGYYIENGKGRLSIDDDGSAMRIIE